MKLFTVEEANSLIPVVRPMLTRIRDLYASMDDFRPGARAAASAAEVGGGGMPGGSEYVRILYDVGKLTAKVGDLGIQLKDYSRGLIDFPCMKGERVILLCWQLGEDDAIAWWHEVDAGFAGRKPL